MQRAKRHDRGDHPWMVLGRLGLILTLALTLGFSLGACGGGDEPEVDTSPVEDAEAPADGEEAADPEAESEDDADADGSAEEEEAVEAPTDEPTEAPTATDEPTEVPTEAPTDPPTAVPATLAPTTPPEPTAEPAPEWFVEFYPDNWTYQIPKDQLCAGVNWRTAGVTDLVVGLVGTDGESVEGPEGKKGDNCFSGKEAEFFMEYKRPDGQVERKVIKIERTKNKSD